MADYTFISANIKLKKMASKIPIQDLESKIYYLDKYTIITFYIEGILPDNTI